MVPVEPLWLSYDLFIGRALYLLRFSKRWTQQELADQTEKEDTAITQNYISKVESGDIRNVPYSRLGVICRHLGCKPSKLIAMAEDLAENEGRPQGEVLHDLRGEIEKRLADPAVRERKPPLPRRTDHRRDAAGTG